MNGYDPDKSSLTRWDPSQLGSPSVSVQHTWYRMTKQDWLSLALVPVDAHVSSLELAHSFGRLAAQEPDSRVLVVNASLAGCWTPEDARPRAPEDIWTFLANSAEQAEDAQRLPYDYLDFINLDRGEAVQALASAHRLLEAVLLKAAYRRCIFAVDDVLTEPEATPLVRAVDQVVLCVLRGDSTLEATRRAIELFDRDKIAGALLIDAAADVDPASVRSESS